MGYEVCLNILIVTSVFYSISFEYNLYFEPLYFDTCILNLILMKCIQRLRLCCVVSEHLIHSFETARG